MVEECLAHSGVQVFDGAGGGGGRGKGLPVVEDEVPADEVLQGEGAAARERR